MRRRRLVARGNVAAPRRRAGRGDPQVAAAMSPKTRSTPRPASARPTAQRPASRGRSAWSVRPRCNQIQRAAGRPTRARTDRYPTERAGRPRSAAPSGRAQDIGWIIGGGSMRRIGIGFAQSWPSPAGSRWPCRRRRRRGGSQSNVAARSAIPPVRPRAKVNGTSTPLSARRADRCHPLRLDDHGRQWGRMQATNSTRPRVRCGPASTRTSLSPRRRRRLRALVQAHAPASTAIEMAGSGSGHDRGPALSSAPKRSAVGR